ncbi:MAG: TRAM domain-containing protein [bacterium]|nr:TRAM domain-containing protein [bacterium]
MLLKIMRFVLVAATTLAGFYLVPVLFSSGIAPFLGIIIGLSIGLFIIVAETLLERNSIETLAAGILGLIVGLIAGNLTAFAVSRIVENSPYILYAIIVLVFGYLGTVIAIVKRRQIGFITRISSGRGGDKKNVLDTSVIIDGRISDILNTGFLAGALIIPRFVLNELQLVADSDNPLKRTRGRRGLDILNTIRENSPSDVIIDETDYEDISAVDEKLVRLAKKLEGNLLTNDYNLNKVAELNGVSVLNVNDLTNALKPVVLPGETMDVNIIREGKERGQGIGYLDDGTMIVVEGGRDNIGRELEVMVTSVLQTAAGRMVFAKTPDESDLKHINALRNG